MLSNNYNTFNRERRISNCLLSLALLMLTSVVSAQQSSENYTMPKNVLSNGGNHSSSANYQLIATIGQNATRKGTANDKVLYSGFYAPNGTPLNEIIQPASCQLYAVNDKGLNNSQFFTVNLNSLAVSELGPVYKAHDIESLAVHPKTDMIYAASGDNTEKQGFFYQVDGKTGELHPIGSTGFKEIEDLTFNSDGILYAWAKGNGLITIDPETGIGTLVLASDIQVEGLTLSNDIFYGSVNTELWTYNMDSNDLQVACTNLLGETEALEMMPYGELLVGTHNVAFGMHAFNPDGCHISTADATSSNKFKDVEGLALPIAACSICGDGVVQGNEQCDDGNTTSGDLCSDICMIE
ncbi:myxococcus cysteine-rich repeat containing protein [Candidatus Halobeggiatoa sp. HSG11]|nr:myxococcus cysteine-rich repeat containing protein [Candidatus Halobeggiatoa sp. HSG11]